MKKALFCIFTLFACVGIFAQQQPVVAVAPFDAISGISTTDANMITRVFFIRLGNTNRVSLVDRNVVDRVLREHSFQAGDWSNQQKTAELGRALNSDWIVRGELESFGTNILVTVQFYDIQTFRFMGGADILLTNASEAMEKMDPLVNRLVETIASSGSQPRQQSGNTGTSAYYGTWMARSGNVTFTLIIEANKITFRTSNGNFFIIANGTWTVASNGNHETLVDYQNGFKVSGVVTEINDGAHSNYLMPIYLFINRSDNNRLELFASDNSRNEIQRGRWHDGGPYGRIH